MLAFNITPFFPSLNYHLLPLILNKVGFDLKVLLFFKNYLTERKTKYLQNKFSSSFCNVNVGVSQGSVLLPILSTLYLSLVLYILKKHLLNLKISISILLFVNDRLLISQNKSSRCPIQIYFVVIMSLLHFFLSLVQLSSMESLKSSTFLGCM